jgi:hypothetical protein
VGLRLGWVTGRGVPPLVSAANHRRHHVAPWTCATTGWPGSWQSCVMTLRGRPWQGASPPPRLRVDDLQPARVRRDSTPAGGAWRVTEDGLWPCGSRQDHRPDLPHVPGLRSVLAPRGVAGGAGDRPWATGG